jgi:hypothetical protein
MMNGSPFGMAPFMKVIGINLKSDPVPSTGGQYGRGFPVPVSSIPFGTDFDLLVDFDALVTRFSSVIAGLFSIKSRFPPHHKEGEGIANLYNN